MTDRVLTGLSRVYVGLAFAFVFAPIITLVIFAFNENRFPSLPWTGFSLDWFRAILGDAAFLAAARRSVAVALAVAILATVLGATAAYFVTRWEFRGKGVYLGIIVAPPCIPLLILGLALLDLPAPDPSRRITPVCDPQPYGHRGSFRLRHCSVEASRARSVS